MHTYDVHIKNGEVIDGTGAPKFKSEIRQKTISYRILEPNKLLMRKIKLFRQDLLMFILMMTITYS